MPSSSRNFRQASATRSTAGCTALQIVRPQADSQGMTISGSAGPSLLQSVLDAQSGRTDTGVALLKKAQDVAKQQGQAMVRVLERLANHEIRLKD